MSFIFNYSSVRNTLFVKNACKVAAQCSSRGCLSNGGNSMKRLDGFVGSLLVNTQQFSWITGKPLKYSSGALCWWNRNLMNCSSRQRSRAYINKSMAPGARVQVREIKTQTGSKTKSSVPELSAGKNVAASKKPPELSDMRRLFSLAKPERWKLCGEWNRTSVTSQI